MDDAHLISFDFPNILDYVTGVDGWIKISNTENTYSYKTKDSHLAEVVIDSTWMTINVDDDLMYDGDWSADPDMRSFAKGDLPPLEEDE